jgi:hypothetical protein
MPRFQQIFSHNAGACQVENYVDAFAGKNVDDSFVGSGADQTNVQMVLLY